MISPSRRRVLSAVALTLPAALAGCSRAAQHAKQPQPANNYFITAEQIAQSGAATAWDALRLTVPILQFRDNGRGVPARITRRGRSSVLLDDSPRVWVDNVRLVDIRDLIVLPAGDIVSIEVLNGLDATTHYGGSSTSGVILIKTKAGT